MSAAGKGRLLAAAVVAAAVMAPLARIAGAVDIWPADPLAIAGDGRAPLARAAPWEEARAAVPEVADLPCFGCHSFDRWRTGDDFPHEDHDVLAEHCHVCHAFEGHFQVTTRRDTCAGCHG